jgi:3-oxoacyl-[acyl-carrier protein] reductase
MKLLKDKVSILTGCNRGIGLSMLKNFAKNGSNIFACVRRVSEEFKKEINNLEKENKIFIKPIMFDLDSPEKVKTAFEEINVFGKKIDVLVNNAGVLNTSLFQMTKISDIKKTFDINFFHTFLFIQYVVKIMNAKKNSSIINISSISAEEANMGRFSYSASKAAVESGTKNLSKEFARLKIRVNSISPGLIETDMLIKNTPSEQIKDRVKNISLQRVGQPEEVSNVALFLASELSSYINGQNIICDGGKINKT